jgi:F0F1-type ATP synthase alpha subunit
MAAFAKFGSDLDEETQRLLNRGSKLTELLKQTQYNPLSMEKQIFSIFAGTTGYLDDLDIKDIASYERGLFSFVDFLQNYSFIFSELLSNLNKESDIYVLQFIMQLYEDTLEIADTLNTNLLSDDSEISNVHNFIY